jgi:hypothetical protein
LFFRTGSQHADNAFENLLLCMVSIVFLVFGIVIAYSSCLIKPLF